MSDEKWVTLTPEQVETLEPVTTIRAYWKGVSVQGPLTSLVGEYGPDVWVGEIRVKSPERIAVRERDVPKPDPQRLVSVRPDGLTEPFVLRMAAVDIETMPLGWGGLPSSLPGTLRTLADAIEEHRAALRGETS